ncbi:LysR substrate-binding domain-containing protein [Rhodospirillaceae bacterium SYSU D60014]|uniref:LysR substrate-binding domain-containing protein n=1 Tax=Virgifigura deserti TaxID=2268457 RepID=UPI000E66F738
MSGSSLPLRAIAVFEAAARLGSFREAAEELSLTPSAVSHQIRILEAGLGVRLFERVGRGVSLSQDGLDYYDNIREGFRKLKQATEKISSKNRHGRPIDIVRIHTPPSFASRWLLPRLSKFLADHPMIDIRVNAEAGPGLDAANVDLAVVYGGASKWESRAIPLLEETVQPLCAPNLVTSGPIRSRQDLLSQTLIRTRVNIVSWEDWLQRQGFEPDGAIARSIQLDPSHVAIEAAIKGLGVILESNILTEDEISSGRLIAPLQGVGLTAMSYWLVTPRPAAVRASVETARRWLLENADCRANDPVRMNQRSS